MINVHIPDSSPTINVDPALRGELVTFGMDIDRYREGLTLVGAPEPLIDSLEVSIEEHAKYRVVGNYDNETNRATILVPKANRRRWQPDIDVESGVNFELAMLTRRMGDIATHRPEVLHLDRALAEKARIDKMFTAATRPLPIAGTLLGGVAGGIFAEGAVAEGAWAGLALSGGATLLANFAKSINPEYTRVLSEIKKRESVVQGRALSFARAMTVEGQLFDGLIQIEFEETPKQAENADQEPTSTVVSQPATEA